MLEESDSIKIERLLILVLLFFTIIPIFTVKFDLRDIFVLAIVAVFGYIGISNMRKKLSMNIDKIDIILFAYLMLLIVYFFMQHDKTVAIKGLLAHIKFILFYWIGKWANIKLEKRNIRKLLKFVIILGLITSLYGIYQYYFDYYSLGNLLSNYDTLFKPYGGFKLPNGFVRPRQMYSIFLSPLTTAYIIACSIIALLSVYIIKLRKKVMTKKNNYTYIISLCILLFALFLTYNRTTFVSLFISLIVFLIAVILKQKSVLKLNLQNRKKVEFIIIGLVILVLISIIWMFKNTSLGYFLSIFSFKNGQETASHYYYLKKGISFLFKYPFGLGLGVSTVIGNHVYANLDTWNECFYFFISTEIGIPGLILYLAAVILMFVKTIKINSTEDDLWRKIFYTMTIILFLNFFISNISLPVYMSWTPTNFIFVFLGLANSNINYRRKVV